MRRLRQKESHISTAAVDVFFAMITARDGEERRALHDALCKQLGTPPWRYPCVRFPNEPCPAMSDDSAQATEFWRARQLYDQLMEALDRQLERDEAKERG